MLGYESKLYEKLKGEPGVPTMYWYGVEGDFNVLVMDILGPPLASLFKFCEHKFSIKTILIIASQLVQRIESLHSKNFIHRDIKPENFLIGQGKKSQTVFMIDFGLSKRYRCPKIGTHIPLIERGGITGTPRYCSLNAHKHYEQSRRDDLEAIGNILIYFCKEGNLPWMRAEEKGLKEMLKIKENTTIEALCEGLPACFRQYMNYCRNLKFEQKPDYKYLKGLFENTFNEQGFENDGRFDWVI